MRIILNHGSAFKMVTVIMACMTLLPVCLNGQDVNKEKLTQAGKKLDEMIQWQKALDEYEAEINSSNRLKQEANTKENERDQIGKRLQGIQTSLQNIFLDKKQGDWFKTLYEQYDTTLLKQVKGHLGDDNSERVVNQLLICHRAEALLSEKYNTESVNLAINRLQSIGETDKSGWVDNIESRLTHYRERTANVRDILQTATKKDAVKRVEQGSSSFKFIKEAREAFFDVIEGRDGSVDIKLDPSVLNPHDYPYLYGVLMDAMKTKLDDPSKMINDLIGKL